MQAQEKAIRNVWLQNYEAVRSSQRSVHPRRAQVISVGDIRKIQKVQKALFDIQSHRDLLLMLLPTHMPIKKNPAAQVTAPQEIPHIVILTAAAVKLVDGTNSTVPLRVPLMVVVELLDEAKGLIESAPGGSCVNGKDVELAS